MKVFLLLLFAVPLGLACWLYTPDRSAAWLAARYVKPDDHFIDVLGARLRVRISGPASAPVVILLHGFGSSLETWEPWASVLDKQYRVIRFDLPGFGLTGPDPSADYTDPRTLLILAALMDRLGVRKADLIGNSLGGKIAWNFAAAYPGRVNRLVLISPDGFASPGFEYGVKPKLPFIMRILPYCLPRFMLRMNLAIAYADPKKLSDATLTRYQDMMLAPGNREAILARTQQVFLEPPEPMLAKISVPTLILWGEEDRMIPFSNSTDYLRDIPHAQRVALPGLGHVPFEENPAASLPPVLAFLSGGVERSKSY